MKLTDSKIHGILNYGINTVLFLSPWLFNYIKTTTELWIPVLAGAIALLCTACTNAGFGIVKYFKLSNLLLIDLILGSFLIVSPKLFQYEGYVYLLPFLWIGLVKCFIALAAGNTLHSKHIEERKELPMVKQHFRQFTSQAHQLVHHLHKTIRQERNTIA